MQRRSLGLIAAMALTIGLASACGSDGPVADLRSGTTVDGATPTPTDAPPATDAPAPTDAPPATDAPAPTQAPVITGAPATTVAPDDGDDDGASPLLIVLIIGGILLAVAVIAGVISRSRRSPAPVPATTTAPSSPQASLLSTSQWITDQLTLELMAAPPETAQQRWKVERRRLDNVAIGAQQQYLEVQDANWQPLAQTMSALASAVDTNLALRAQDPPDAQLIGESTEVVNRHRTAIQQLVAALRPTIDRPG